MRKVFLFLIVAAMGVTGWVSSAYAVSEAAVLSLMISPGARAAGMGEAFVALADDATATYWNPAGLAFQYGKELHFMHVNWLPEFGNDMFYDFATYIHHVEGIGTFGLNVTYLNLGEQIHTDETGAELGKFGSNEYSIALTYGTKMSENWSVGLGMRYIRSNLAGGIKVGAEQGEGVANGFAFDVATLYKFPFAPKLSFGVNLSNMGPKISYIDVAQADPLPTNLRFGFAYKLVESEFNKLSLVMDVNKLMVTRNRDGSTDPFYKALFTSPWTTEEVTYGENKEVLSKKTIFNGTVSGGVEYWYSNIFALRAGYYWDEPGKVKYTSFGGGIQYHLYRFDFGYVAAPEGHPLANTMRFSLTIGF
ncbi:MAG: PorV/PorQ family protein [candidate division KSB1 bacterium]|nr:PorV/PorQ family protein [candidate division KSB1 bacterium]MDZ7346991.1 PorV/PorQ family protein [candidate division KSB1 bacterium]